MILFLCFVRLFGLLRLVECVCISTSISIALSLSFCVLSLCVQFVHSYCESTEWPKILHICRSYSCSCSERLSLRGKERERLNEKEWEHWCRTINGTNLISSYEACGHINGVKERVYIHNGRMWRAFALNRNCRLFVHSFSGSVGRSVGVNALLVLSPNAMMLMCGAIIWRKIHTLRKICSIEPFSPAALFICCHFYLSACPRFT